MESIILTLLMLIKKRAAGFTIVELLIVIVVIGILAAVVIVAYSGATRRAQTSSLQLDVSAMDKAQKFYMATNDTPVTYDTNGNANTLLVFAANQGNSIVVRLKGTNNYCIYGYNPASDYPTPSTALIRSSDSTPCAALPDSTPTDPSSVYSTVAIIGQRIETFNTQNGYYPHVNDLGSIGLNIKPNNGNANQQQLYCRNNTKAIYLQIDTSSSIAYVYETASHAITQITDPGKLSLNTICPQYGISPSDPGYESTGVQDPNIT